MTQTWTQEERNLACSNVNDGYEERWLPADEQGAVYESIAIDLACERNLLRDVLEMLLRQCESWHEFHHNTIIQCDSICDHIPAARAALDRCGK